MPFGPYEAYGLVFDSDVDCPELLRSSRTGDVRVRYGSVPNPSIPGALFEAAPGRALFRFDSVARYSVTDGHDVTIDPARNASHREIRACLFNAAFAALLHQRGVLALHAAAVSVGHRAVLFAGPSGAGKSTLLAALVARGYRMLSDDVAAITLDGAGNPIVHPGVPQMRLWSDAATRVGVDIASLETVELSGAKYIVPAPRHLLGRSQPLDVIYVLEAHDTPELRIEPFTGAARFEALRRHTYGRRIMYGLANEVPHFMLTTAVAHRVPILSVKRPRTLDVLDELADRVETLSNKTLVPSA